MDDKSIHLEFDVAGDNFNTAGSASDAVKSKLKLMGVNPEDIRRVAISMYEGEINMVIHAGGGKAVVDIFADKIDIQLNDTGKGIEDIEQAMQPGFSTANDEVRALGFGAGMGLPNIKKYTDEFNIKSEVGKGTNVRLEIDFH